MTGTSASDEQLLRDFVKGDRAALSHLAERYERLLLGLSSGLLGGLAFLANILTFAGKPQEAIVKAQTAIRLNPTAPAWYLCALARAHYECKDYRQAIAAAEQSLSRDSHEVEARLIKTAAHEALGEHEQAAAEAPEVLQVNSHFSLANFARTQPYQDRAVLDGLLDLLRKAGLPD